MDAMVIPDEFGALPRSSPFLDMVGGLQCRRHGPGIEFGLRVEQRHTNSSGFVHGGLLATIADLTLGYNTGLFGPYDPTTRLVTASLTIDFAAAARVGDWLSATAEVLSRGKRLGFANCYIAVGEQRVARASGVFSVVPLRT
jgi:uncharacterized protein (TIGR00369 family)